MEHVQQLRMELHKPIQPGNTLRGYLQDLDRIRTSLEDLAHPVKDSDLIACLVNGLRVPEYQSERNYLVHNPQVDFDKACSLCRKTANQDVVVGAAAGSTLPAAFYGGSPTAPSPPTYTRYPSGAAPEVPSKSSTKIPDMVETLSKLTKSVDMATKQLVSQAASIKSLEDKVGKINQRLDGNRGKAPYQKPAGQGGMKPSKLCTYCNNLVTWWINV